MGYVNKTYLSTQFKNFADKIAKVFSKIGHTHLKSDITDFPTSMPANGGNAATVGGHTVGVNVPSNAKFTDTTYSKLSEFTDDVGYVKNTDARLTDARNAKDVYAWAKASTKPTYTASEVGLGNVDNTADSANTVYAAQRMIIQENRIDGNLESFEFNPEYSREHLGTASFDIVGYDKENKVMTYGNSIDAIDTRYALTTFKSNDSTTGDSTPPSLLASGETHASIFSKVSTIFKNVRWLLSKMGTTDISSIGNGTVTGALSKLNSNIAKKQNIIYFGTFLYVPTVQAKQLYNFDADLKNLNLQGKSIFWGYAYQLKQSGANVLFQEAAIISSWTGDRVSVLLYNGHDTAITIPVLCVAFAT